MLSAYNYDTDAGQRRPTTPEGSAVAAHRFFTIPCWSDVCKQHALPRTRFSHAQLLYSHLVTDFTHWPRASRVAQESRSTLSVSCPKTVILHRAMSQVTPHLMTPSTGILSSHVLHPPLSEHKPCGDLRPHLRGALVEPRPFTDYEPKQLAEDQDHRHFTEDKQFTEHEDLRVKHLSFYQPITASTCG